MCEFLCLVEADSVLTLLFAYRRTECGKRDTQDKRGQQTLTRNGGGNGRRGVFQSGTKDLSSVDTPGELSQANTHGEGKVSEWAIWGGVEDFPDALFSFNGRVVQCTAMGLQRNDSEVCILYAMLKGNVTG